MANAIGHCVSLSRFFLQEFLFTQIITKFCIDLFVSCISLIFVTTYSQNFYILFSVILFMSSFEKPKTELNVKSCTFTFGIPVPQLISISCCRRETEQPSNWSSADVENYRLISLERLEIRFTVSDGQDLFDFWQKSPIVSRTGKGRARSSTRRNWMQDLLVKSKDIVTRYGPEQREQKKEKGYQTLYATRERSNLYNRRDPFPHFFDSVDGRNLSYMVNTGDKQREGGTETAFADSLLSYRLWSITHCFGTHWLSPLSTWITKEACDKLRKNILYRNMSCERKFVTNFISVNNSWSNLLNVIY